MNKRVLPDEQLLKLFAQMSSVLGKASSRQIENILSELLGREERTMLAKRLAIIVLLVEGKSLYSIAQKLKVSPTTAKKIKFKLDSGGYHHILCAIGKTRRDYLRVLKTLDSILHLGGFLPHYNGIERYRHL